MVHHADAQAAAEADPLSPERQRAREAAYGAAQQQLLLHRSQQALHRDPNALDGALAQQFYRARHTGNDTAALMTSAEAGWR